MSQQDLEANGKYRLCLIFELGYIYIYIYIYIYTERERERERERGERVRKRKREREWFIDIFSCF